MLEIPASTANETLGTTMRKATMMTDANGKGLIIFLKSPGNPAAFMDVYQSFRLACSRTRTMTTADPTAKTEPTTAALA